MINIKDPKDCCGCTACASICAHDAITMKPDALGFLYPEVDTTKCVNCGLCDKVCDFNDSYDRSLNFTEPMAYGVRHKDMKEVETSRSGAAFIAISDWILAHGGVVYGAGYTDHFRVVHKRATNKEERDEFKGSKYVQSDLTGIFRQINQDLHNGLIVMFSGTPCQTAGLNSFIGKKYREKLYLVDIACHGIPGPFLWRDYLRYVENRQMDVLTYVNFRDKQLFGWKAHKESFMFRKTANFKKTFDFTFYKHIFFRMSCGNCHYTNLHRPSDLTLADFWHYENNDSSLGFDNKGLSLVLSNTEKGQALLDIVRENFVIFQLVDVNKSMQQALKEPFSAHPLRPQFERDYQTKGFEYAYSKYCNKKRRSILGSFLQYFRTMKKQ